MYTGQKSRVKSRPGEQKNASGECKKTHKRKEVFPCKSNQERKSGGGAQGGSETLMQIAKTPVSGRGIKKGRK